MSLVFRSVKDVQFALRLAYQPRICVGRGVTDSPCPKEPVINLAQPFTSTAPCPRHEDHVHVLNNSKKSSKGLKIITTKARRRKLTSNIPSITINGISFHQEDSVQRWKYVVQKRMADEQNIYEKHHSYISIIDLIVKASLSKTIFDVGPFYPKLIREFIVNLPSDLNDPSSSKYQLVHIKGSLFKPSPYILILF